MNLLLFSDLHAHQWKRHSQLIDGQNSRLLTAVDILKQIERAVDRHKVDWVIFLGDLFHTRGSIDIEVWNAIVPALWGIGAKVPVTFLVGNHDMSRKIITKNTISFQTICEASGDTLTMIDQPTLLMDRFVFLPYFEDSNASVFNDGLSAKEGLSYLLDEIEAEPAIVFAHVGINGAMVQKQIRLKTAVPVTMFYDEKIDKVFTGHYHIPQVIPYIGSDPVTTPIWYVGATHQHNWGDAGQERGYTLYDTDTDEARRFKLKAPRFIELHLNTLDDLEGVAKYFKNNFIKVYLPSDNIRSMASDLREEAKTLLPGDLIIVAEPEEKPTVVTTTSKKSQKTDTVVTYVETQGEKGKRAERLIKYGYKLLEGSQL